MTTRLVSRSSLARAQRMAPAATILSALAAVLVPKCPMCVAAYLVAFGAAASVARGAAPFIVFAAKLSLGLAIVILALYAMKFLRRRLRRNGVAAPADCGCSLQRRACAVPRGDEG